MRSHATLLLDLEDLMRHVGWLMSRMDSELGCLGAPEGSEPRGAMGAVVDAYRCLGDARTHIAAMEDGGE